MTADAIDLALGDVERLEEVVDRDALNEVCRSFFDLFGISIRIFSASGALLADVHSEQDVCAYVNTFPEGRRACAETVGNVKRLLPRRGAVIQPCFTGASYRVVPIEYQGRQVARMIVGPYLAAEKREVPRSLLRVAAGVVPDEARRALESMPRVRGETAERVAAHLLGVLDLILFSSHRAHLTSEMHVASVRESYRELAEKTAQLQRAFDRLKELDRLKSNFLATVSHELRTPLTSIIGYSEMLSTGIAGDLNEEQREFVETIRSKGDHLLALISTMLDMNKLEQGRVTLQHDAVDPQGLIAEVAKTVMPQANKKQVGVRTEVEEGLPMVSADPVRLRQVLFNLADNAVKFTPTGGTVSLRARSAELQGGDDGAMGVVLMSTGKPAVELSVQDTGVGIAPEEHEKVFDAFYQVDGSSTREHGGAGLGLSIVKRLVDAHHGTIRVHSAVGRGTTFFVTIPVSAEPGGA